MPTVDLEELFRSLMSFEVTSQVSTADALEQIGILIDVAGQLGRPEGAERGIELAEQCLDRSPAADAAALLHYFKANAWSHLQAISRHGTDSNWDWEQPEIEQELVHLRRAIGNEGFQSLPDIRRCQIATNFGNVLSHVGRFAEAIEYWDRALSVDPNFSMALANRGRGLVEYARALYDDGHQPVFLRQAHINLSAGLENGADPQAVEVFERHKAEIEGYLPEQYLRDGTEMNSFSLGDSEEERQYRRWCLETRLFLNPLNDLGPSPIAAHDCFTVPSIVVNIGEGPTYHGFFNQLKQEFVSARFLHYEGNTADEAHFADKDVLLYNTFDYPAYSLAVEKTKIAFRMAYSLFDKIAFFLNDYLQLGVPERRVSFRTIWYDGERRDRGLKSQFQRYENWPLRGLFWLSKDLFEDEPGFRDAIEPDAQELNDLRNHAEHKYLKVHDAMWSPELAALRASQGTGDRLGFSVGRHDFETKSLRMLKHARAGLIYLSLGVHCEEQRRRTETGESRLSLPMFLDTWEDEWKV